MCKASIACQFRSLGKTEHSGGTDKYPRPGSGLRRPSDWEDGRPERGSWGDTGTRSNEPRRLRIQIYVDVLLAIHRSQRNGEPSHLYALERAANLTYPRLQACLDELRRAGLIGASLDVTDRGYAFLEEVTTKVAPIMMKYGMWQDHI